MSALMGASINAALRQQEKPYNRPVGEEMQSPFGGWRHHLSPSSRWHNNPCLLQSRLRRGASRCFILPPKQGEVRRSRIGGGERSEPIRRMLIMPYDTVRSSRNADFISIALRAIHNPRGRRPRQTYEPSGRRPVHLKNPHTAGVSKNAAG